MNIKDAKRLVRSIGMSVEDGLGFTVCGSQLVNGEDAPEWIAEMNGWCIDEIAEKIKRRNNAAARTKLGSVFTDTATLLVGDPCKILEGDACLLGWDGYVDACGDYTKKVVEIPDPIGRAGALSVQVGSDGWYPVYLETDKEGKPARLVIELGGQVEP